MGRIPKLTPDIIDKLCEARALGARDPLMCQYAGVSERAYYLWMQNARESPRPKKINLQLLQRLDAAKATAAADCLEGIKKMGCKDWKAFKFLLQHLYPGEYLDADSEKNTINNNNTNENNFKPLTAEQKKEVESELAAFLGDDKP